MAVDRTFAVSDLGVAACDVDLVTEKTGALAGGMCDQGLAFREFQTQCFQGIGHLLLDGLGFLFGARKTQDEVIPLTAVFQPPIVRIVGVHRWDPSPVLRELPIAFKPMGLPGVLPVPFYPREFWVALASIPTRVLGG